MIQQEKNKINGSMLPEQLKPDFTVILSYSLYERKIFLMSRNGFKK